MKIGLYFTPTKNDGGVYQYCIAFLESLSTINGNSYVIFSTSKDIPIEFTNLKNFKIKDMNTGFTSLICKWNSVASYSFSLFFKMFPKIHEKSKILNLVFGLYKMSQFGLIKIFEKEKLDIIFFPAPVEFSTFISIPFVVSVHDLQHKIHPHFKEVSANGIGRHRDFNYTNISQYAYRIFVDSMIGKNDILNFYPKSKGKVQILPFLTPSYINPNVSSAEMSRVKQKYSLPDNYIFYPAKFWPHKNHKNLIRALAILKKRGKRVNLVLTGSKKADFSSFEEVMKLIDKNGMSGQVFYLGLVSNEELSVIYKLAKALVMPTYFGPTNIPILEAWAMDVPAIYSNIRGCYEQLGNAGLLIDPDNPVDIADKIMKIYTQPKLVSELIRKGKRRVNKWTLKDFTARIREVLEDFELNRYVAPKSNKK